MNQHHTKSPVLVASLETTRWFLHMRVGVRDYTLWLRNLEIFCAFSRSYNYNLGILRMRNAISRLRKFSDCAEHTPYAFIAECISVRFWMRDLFLGCVYACTYVAVMLRDVNLSSCSRIESHWYMHYTRASMKDEIGEDNVFWQWRTGIRNICIWRSQVQKWVLMAGYSDNNWLIDTMWVPSWST